MSISRPVMGLVAAATLVSLVAPPASAAPSYDGKPVAQGAGWLSGQLTKDLVHNEQFQFDDIGLSIDFALGLDAAGKKATVAKSITKAVTKNVAFYVGDGDQGIYAGPTAKAAVLARSQGKNPRSFGGVDLVKQLEGRVAATASIAGRIQDAYDPTSEFGGDFANVIGQAYAAQALSDAKSAMAGSVASFLLEQQCSDGYFRLGFTKDKTAADQSCDGAPKSQRTADTDATAIVVLALQHLKGAAAKKAVKTATAWLIGVQAANGSFGGGKSTRDANSNSTGLAGWALGATGATEPAARAAAWVRNLQVAANPCANQLATSAGAIAYDDTAYGNAQGLGIKKRDQDQWRRASAQALPVLQWAPRAAGDLSASSAHSVRSGEQFRINVAGVAPGQRVCVSSGASTYEFESGKKATTHVSFAVDGSGAHTYQVWVGNQHRDVTVRVLG
ncbi:MAG: hypothetical protein ABIO16_01540 [Nocardioides sp.]